MSLMQLTAEFVKKLNQVILSIKNRDKDMIEDIKHIISRLDSIKSRTVHSEGLVLDFIKKKENNRNKILDHIVVRYENRLRAIISRSVQKPHIEPVNKIETICTSSVIEFGYFNPPSDVMVIETEKQLFDLDKSLQSVCLCVYDHNYRSYDGFTCYITVVTSEGEFYAIDAIKFREVIPSLRLLKCDVKKLIHCRDCVKRLIKDFGSIGCYRNFDIPKNDVYIDWRIRPLDDMFVAIMLEQIQELVEKSNMQITTERYEFKEENEAFEIIEKYSLPYNCPFLGEMLKMRQYLAKQHDESPKYVLSDKQLIELIEKTPLTVQDFELIVPRMSSVLRPHVSDFILILRKKSKCFSVDRLKETHLNNIKLMDDPLISEEPKYRSFTKNLNKNFDSTSSEFSESE